MVCKVVNLHHRPWADHAELIHRADLGGGGPDFRYEFKSTNGWEVLISRQNICLEGMGDHCELILNLIDLMLDFDLVVFCHQVRISDCDHQRVV